MSQKTLDTMLFTKNAFNTAIWALKYVSCKLSLALFFWLKRPGVLNEATWYTIIVTFSRTVWLIFISFPANIYLFQVNNRNTGRCEICSKLTIKTSERRYWCCSGVFIVNFEYIWHLVLVLLFLTNHKQEPCSWTWSSNCATSSPHTE